MLISIFASIWSKNLWDELILKNEIKMLERRQSGNTKFIVFSHDPRNPFFEKRNIEYKEYFPTALKEKGGIVRNMRNFFSFIQTVRKSDLVIIGGGGLIYDNEKDLSKNPLDIRLFRTKICKLFRKKVEFFRIGIDIKNTWNSQKGKSNLEKVREIFSVWEHISVRDHYSHELLKQLWIPSSVKKDPVFYDRNKEIIETSLIQKIESHSFSYRDLEKFDLGEKKIGFALRKWYLTNHNSNIAEKMEEWKINEIIYFILEAGWEVILLPHSFHNQSEAANDFLFLKQFLRDDVLKKYPGRIHICEDMSQTYSVYQDKKIDLCIAQRLHSIILSDVYEIPFIGLSYGTKTQEVLWSLQLTKKQV